MYSSLSLSHLLLSVSLSLASLIAFASSPLWPLSVFSLSLSVCLWYCTLPPSLTVSLPLLCLSHRPRIISLVISLRQRDSALFFPPYSHTYTSSLSYTHTHTHHQDVGFSLSLSSLSLSLWLSLLLSGR